jgi:DNA-binding response OmpR family regulator
MWQHSPTQIVDRSDEVNMAASETITIGALRVRAETYEVWYDGRAVNLTRGEFHVLWKLATNAGRVISADRLASTGGDARAAGSAVRTMVFALRRKLGPHAGQLQTVRHGGYVLGE